MAVDQSEPSKRAAAAVPELQQEGAGAKKVVRIVLATIAVLLGILAGVFSASTQTHEICVLSAVVIIAAVGPTIDELTPLCPLITMPVGSCYTFWNCLLLTYTLFDHFVWARPPLLLPYVVVNSWAIFASFNVIRLFDDTFYQRAARRTGYSLPVFHFGNTALHTLPAVGSSLWFAAQPAGHCLAARAGIPLLSTVFYHLLWILRVERSLYLDKTYFQCPQWQWIMAWTAALATHFLVARDISQQCLEKAF